ncbi:hypothetical protein BCR44DRAFT_1483650 [Catenaria anguillulae PL171]|uniref:Uncharacterized protein n=1 Tax=Catenaria anguillulae PL171 TaxID=765915 RepID=A0A1Y2HW47_9FUNG|nr:hypothetical protein BCR44DRAFT_1483650 [Catenaria anguillulae PL171]
MHPASTANPSATSANLGGSAGTYYSMDGPTLHHSHRTSAALGHHHLNLVTGYTDVGTSKLPLHLHVHSHQHQPSPHHVSPPTSPSTARRTRPPAPGRTSRRRATVGQAQLSSPSAETASRRYPSNENLSVRDRNAATPDAGYAISSSTMDKLQKIGQELLHKYTSACTDLDSLKTSASVLDAELATLRSTNDQLTQRNALLTSDLDAAKSQVATLESTLADSQSAHALAMSAVQAQQAKLDASEKEWGQQVKAAEHEAAEVRAKLERAEARGRDLKEGYTQACQDRDTALARAADAESTVSRLESELAALRASIDEAAIMDSPSSPNLSKDEVSLLLSTLANLQCAHDQLQSEHADVLNQFRQVQDDLARAREDHTAAAAAATQPLYEETFDSDVSAWLLQADSTPGSPSRSVQRTASVSLGDEMAAAAAVQQGPGDSMSFALAVGGSTMSQRMVVDAWTQSDEAHAGTVEGGISSEAIQEWVKHMNHLVDSAHELRARIHTADPASIRRSRSATPVFGVSAPSSAADWSWDDLCCMGHEVLDAIEGELSKLVSVPAEVKPLDSHGDRDGDTDEALAFSASNKQPPAALSIDNDDEAQVSHLGATPAPALLSQTKSTIQSLLHTILTDAITQQRSVIDTSRAYVAIVDAKAAEFSRQAQLEHDHHASSPPPSAARSRAGTNDSRQASTRQRVRTSDSATATRARSPFASPTRAPAAGSQSVGASPARGLGGAMGGQQAPSTTPVKKARARLFGVF